jgi:hypothetical protein
MLRGELQPHAKTLEAENKNNTKVEIFKYTLLRI